MPAHARTGRDGSLEIDIAVLPEGAEVCSSEGLRGDAYFEAVCGEGGDGEAGSVYADTVAECAVSEDGGGVGDCECCAIISGFEFGDDYRCEKEGKWGVGQAHLLLFRRFL